jgi:hypothetical protein
MPGGFFGWKALSLLRMKRAIRCLGYKTPLEVAEVIMAGTTEATAYIAQGVYAVNNRGVALSG